MLGITALRDWDFLLLKRYPPQYFKREDECSLCTYGPCHINDKKKGICGIGLNAHLSRISLFTAVTGAAGHASLAESVTSELIEKFGKDYPLTLSNGEPLQTPLIRLICGFKPEVLSDMKIVTSYINREITSLLSVLNMGQEGEWIDFESKTLHAGMLDNLALEVVDMSQIAALKFPTDSHDTPLQKSEVRGTHPVDGSQKSEVRKPSILCIGHNSITGMEIMQYLDENNLSDQIDLYGLCCMAADMSRIPHTHHVDNGGQRGVRIVGNQRDQLRFIKKGIADLIILDSQCIRADILYHASKKGIPVIATSPECCLGLSDRTGDEIENIIDDLLSKKVSGILMLDKKKVAQVAVKAALKRGQNQKVRDQGSDLNKGYKIRIGRGAISDREIKNVAPQIIMGEIPGIVGFFGCPNYSTPSLSPPYKGGERGGVLDIAKTLIDRDYIVTSGGCVAVDLAGSGDGVQSLFEDTTGRFDAGGFANLGSCVSASHLLGAAIKIASVMLHRSIDGNYKEIADYILNRVGVVIIIWGPMSQKAFATATGANRLGIPVIFGKKGERYGRLLKGDNNCDWKVTDMRSKRDVIAGPNPAHLLTVVDSPLEAVMMAAKLCMRPNDTSKGRQIKLKNYIESGKQFSRNSLPDDTHLFVRTEYDIPDEYRDEVCREIKTRNWKPLWIPDPTLLKSVEFGKK
jgi:CO dehydrogenase/acetyl-CoA synthase alpha subunit